MMEKIKVWLLGLSALGMGILALLYKKAKKDAILAKLKHLQSVEEDLAKKSAKKMSEVVKLGDTVKAKRLKARELAKKFRESK